MRKPPQDAVTSEALRLLSRAFCAAILPPVEGIEAEELLRNLSKKVRFCSKEQLTGQGIFDIKGYGCAMPLQMNCKLCLSHWISVD